MKITIDIPETLLRSARKIAVREGTTVRALVEQGLRRMIEHSNRRRTFHLRKVSFRGRGLRPELRNVSWKQLRALAYGSRGG
jgi:hypothetical protein